MLLHVKLVWAESCSNINRSAIGSFNYVLHIAAVNVADNSQNLKGGHVYDLLIVAMVLL